MRYRITLEVRGTGMYEDMDGVELAQRIRGMAMVGDVKVVRVEPVEVGR